MTAIIIVLSLVWYGIMSWVYIMSIVVFLFAWVYILMENNALPTTQIHINEWGISIGTSRYDYPSIVSFSVISISGVPTYLRLKIRKKIAPVLDIPLTQDVNPVALKEFLIQYIDEDETASLSNSDAIIHAMRL